MHADWSQIETAEELFSSLGLTYDPNVLRTFRVPILRQFGQAIARLGIGDGPNEESLRRQEYGRLLREVYEGYAAGTTRGVPLGHPREPPLYALRRPRRPAE